MKKLTPRTEDFAQWYQEVIMQAELVDHCQTRGCFVIRPYAYSLWENIVAVLDKKIKQEGVGNAYFPLLIPQSFLSKEADHVEGFAPELAVVTHGGGKLLEEPLVVRPTSETMVYSMFAQWITSWRDLPLKVNQWANVVRWEMRTRPFVRTLEFLWQEGHTAHATQEEAVTMSETMLAHYKNVYEEYCAIPVVAGMKSESEKFAGAERTYTIEGLMQDGKALQMCTSHVLAHSFPASFDISFQDKDGENRVPFCTSWGFTTRSIGAIIMVHGDDVGLIMPPRIAPIQVVIVPIAKNDEERAAVMEVANSVKKILLDSDVRVLLDDSDHQTPGAKFYHWESRGVPLRIEIGPRDVADRQVVLVDRLEQDKKLRKQIVGIDQLDAAVVSAFESLHTRLFKRAQAMMDQHTHRGDKLSQFGPALEANNGIYQTGWCGDAACEEKLGEFKGSIRCLLKERNNSHCFNCDQVSKQDVVVAKSY